MIFKLAIKNQAIWFLNKLKYRRWRSFSPKDYSSIVDKSKKEIYDKIESNSTVAGESYQIDQETSKPNSISANNISDNKHTVFNIGLSHDLLKKFDEQNMNQTNGGDYKNQISSINWYTSNLASSTSNINLKTAKPK